MATPAHLGTLGSLFALTAPTNLGGASPGIMGGLVAARMLIPGTGSAVSLISQSLVAGTLGPAAPYTTLAAFGGVTVVLGIVLGMIVRGQATVAQSSSWLMLLVAVFAGLLLGLGNLWLGVGNVLCDVVLLSGLAAIGVVVGRHLVEPAETTKAVVREHFGVWLSSAAALFLALFVTSSLTKNQ